MLHPDHSPCFPHPTSHPQGGHERNKERVRKEKERMGEGGSKQVGRGWDTEKEFSSKENLKVFWQFEVIFG